MQNRRGSGKHGDALCVGHEICVGDCDCVFAERNGVEVKLAGIIRAGFQIELGGLCFQYNLNAGNRAVLRIVDDAAHRAEDRGKTRCGKRESKKQ